MGNSVSKFCGFCAREVTVENLKSALAADDGFSEENGNIVDQIYIPNGEVAANIPEHFEETARQNGIDYFHDVFDSKFEWEYKMDHVKRGKTLIFNHYEFNDSLNLWKRKATDKDCKKLLDTFASLNFEVEIYRDSTFYEIQETLKKIAEEDHSDEDCLAIFILTHGGILPDDKKAGVNRSTILTHDRQSYVCAKDRKYPLQTIFKYFTNENCPSLANKPRLFFIQACQGAQSDAGFQFEQCSSMNDNGRDEMKSETDAKIFKDNRTDINNETGVKLFEDRILPHKDFLVVYASMPGFYSYRNIQTGAWFIDELCNVINDMVQKKLNLNLLELITSVIRNVACEHESNNGEIPEIDGKKQIPCVNSMLTKLLYFKGS